MARSAGPVRWPCLPRCGLVARVPSPTDARSVRIALTESGRQAFAEADATRRQALAEVFDALLDDQDIQTLETVWAKLKRSGSAPRHPGSALGRRYRGALAAPYRARQRHPAPGAQRHRRERDGDQLQRGADACGE